MAAIGSFSSTSQTAATPFGSRPICPSSSFWFSWFGSRSRHHFFASSRALQRREMWTMQSVHCAFLGATMTSSSRHYQHPKDMKLKVAASEYARMVYPEPDWHVSDSKCKRVNNDHRKNENPETYGNSRMAPFRVNDFNLTLKIPSMANAERSWETEARMLKQNKEMAKESFKGCSSSNFQQYLNVKLTGSLFKETNKEGSVSGNSGKSITLFGSHCPFLPTSNDQMSIENSVATDEVNGLKQLKGSGRTVVPSNGSFPGLVLDDHQELGSSGDTVFRSEDHSPRHPSSTKQISRAKSTSTKRINGSKQLKDSIGAEVSGDGLSEGAISDDLQDRGHMDPNTITTGKTNGNGVASIEETDLVYQDDIHKQLARIYDKVLVVDNISAAKEVVLLLTTKYRHLVHACDTEVSNIDVKQETPVDHGEITCFSIYSGEDADFGNWKSCIWVDILDGGGKDLLKEFVPFFEDQSIKKVWHNYSFDSHVIHNYGLELSGFHADTMHMARLWDSSRRTTGGYSLEALSGDSNVMQRTKMRREEKELIGKTSMKTIFGKKKVKKDGTEGKMITIPPVEQLQREERKLWICYSALDSISTLRLYESLKNKLSSMYWVFDGKPVPGKSMYNFYEEYWQPFGELLVKMEREGMLVDRTYLAQLEKVAKAEQVIAANRFRTWASRYCDDAKYMNVGSDTQLRQLLYGGILNSKDPNVSLPDEKIFKVPNVDKVIEEGKKAPTKFRNIKLHSIGVKLPVEIYTATGWPSVSGVALKSLAGKVSAEYDFSEATNDGDIDDLPETMTDVDTSEYGTAFAAFEDEEKGREACHAIASLCEVCSIDSLISNFILPLQGSNVSGKSGRVHCSLNINTETGRLSARRPNLQNQPALEKDRYKIRQAFVAAPGNSLVVADYGQLELRILAHLASCKSMLDAFKAGGDFHSRTAMNMYSHILEAVEKGHVLLEWHPQPGEEKPPVPLLKDAFGSERRKAKMLNFSIAYGKTPVGLAKDWKVSVEEAKNTVDLWYRERQEVLEWQKKRKFEAQKFGCVKTLLGRARRFPSFAQCTRAQRGHIERAAINTPVQGSAADVAMCAMLQISTNKRLKELGWRLLLQVHDEVILEGPSDSAEIAKAIVVDCMSKPFGGKNILKVDLAVDAKCAQNWYAAK
ncbi:DNA polymerase I A [Hibiscus syriacus]|uniref:DNA-directed DNA polymerase n=1 Tax=Hibiscus syriacus TaxID=106335 RepID=A0A6A2W9X8_HIBSY|nr:DNA polymerase I A, chloroplastic/mitochondrial-like [Hibiscus syriacus]KAE8654238.1 DNA polymerase I A [Hibiscus syriacus]